MGWLGWLLLRQDAIADAQRRQERLEQAADRAAAVMDRALAALQSRALSPLAASDIPPGVSIVTVTPAGVDARPRLVFSPAGPPSCDDDAALFAPGERLEFARANLAAAAREYQRLVRGGHPQVTTGALIRLARVHRKRGHASVALDAYRQLAQVTGDPCVEGAPSSLLAGVGLASVFAETGRKEELREEAGSLARDLLAARWPLSESRCPSSPSGPGPGVGRVSSRQS